MNVVRNNAKLTFKIGLILIKGNRCQYVLQGIILIFFLSFIFLFTIKCKVSLIFPAKLTFKYNTLTLHIFSLSKKSFIEELMSGDRTGFSGLPASAFFSGPRSSCTFGFFSHHCSFFSTPGDGSGSFSGLGFGFSLT